MKIKKVNLKNYRRLENVEIPFESEETVFVGPNNSGKTSATSAFRNFLVRPNFKIHDFSISKISEIDSFGTDDGAEAELPSIGMDIWFSVNPDVEFGRVFSLVLSVSEELDEVGVRIQFCVKDKDKLKTAYLSAFPLSEDGSNPQSLSHFLSLPGNLSRHFGLRYDL